MSNTEPPSDDTASITDVQTHCVLFRLPRELRDTIYNHVFGTGLVEGPVQVADALHLAPQSDLTVTRRRIYDEATAVHQTAYTSYWTNNVFQYSFFLAHDRPMFTTRRLKHITRVIQHRDFGSFYEDLEIRFMSGDGEWDLVYEHEAAHGTRAGVVCYQLAFQKRDDGDWRVVRYTKTLTPDREAIAPFV